MGTKQILLTVVQTTPILTLLLTESNMKKLAMKAVFHLGTSLYTRLHRSVLTWVLTQEPRLALCDGLERGMMGREGSWEGRECVYNYD